MVPYYDEGGITIYHGDFREMDLTADVVLTDPPYGVSVDYDVHDDRDRGDYWPRMVADVKAMRAMASIVVFTHRIAALRHLTGWDWIYCWNKPHAMSGLHALPVMPHWEPIFAYGVKMRKDLPRGFDVFSFNPAVASKSSHPCPKPVPLFVALVERFVLPNAVVLDPYAGSGSTLVAAKACARRAIGVEISERYCELIAERVGQEVLDFGAA